MTFSKRALSLIFSSAVLSMTIQPVWADATSETKAEELPSVMVQKVVIKNVSPVFEQVGRVEAIEKVAIRARVEGFLEKRNFVEGSMVEKDQVLFNIEKDTYQIALDQKKADVMSAKATLKNASADLKRKKDLRKKNLISQADIDSAEATRDTAKAQVLLAQAALRQAELNLSYTDVVSPIKGMVGVATYTEGNLISPNSDPLATVNSVDPIYVSMELSEKNLLKAKKLELENAKKGIRAIPSLLMSDGSTYKHTGVFSFLGTEIDPSSDTVKIRATFPNPDDYLLPGQYVTVSIDMNSNEMSAVVPQQAVQKDNKGYYVLVVDKENKIEVRRVEMGRQYEGDWAVKSGLEKDELVVTQGLQKVKADSKVNPVEEKEETE